MLPKLKIELTAFGKKKNKTKQNKTKQKTNERTN